MKRLLWLGMVVAPLICSGADKPLKVLLVTGGCCHEYSKQKDVLKKGLEERANVVVEQLHTEDSSTKAAFDIYKNPDWAKGYDLIIHDECSSDITDKTYVGNILGAHEKVPAVNLHCAMHSYRVGDDSWFAFTGSGSNSHGPQEPIAISFSDMDHPITKGMTNWTTVREELYNSFKVQATARPLATGVQKYKRGEKEIEDKQMVIWVNEYKGTRVFSTTLGHNTATVADPRYLDLVTRGALWAVGKLDDKGSEFLKKSGTQ